MRSERARVFQAMLATLLLTASLVGPSFARSDSGKMKGRPVVVGKDPAGDWGENRDLDAGTIGDALAQDLVGASIEMADRNTINFIFRLNTIPSAGGIPELTRYAWEMEVDRNYFMLDGRFTNYHRGICDPTAGNCPPARDPGFYPFQVRTECVPRTPYYLWCDEKAFVQGRVDPPAGTITVPVPLEVLDAEAGSEIGMGAGLFYRNFGGNVVAAPAAWHTDGNYPADRMTTFRTFTVPRR